MFRRLSMFFLAALFALPLFVNADSQLERWKSEGLVFAVRNDQGEFERWGRLQLETWSGEEKSSWVVRTEDGQFRTGYRGHVENWETTSGRQVKRLVIREADSKRWVTWAPFEEDLTEGWEHDARNGWRYVVRHAPTGKFVNVASGELEVWKNWKNPVLVVRDTADGDANGQLVTFLPGKVEEWRNGQTRVVYRTPGGQFLTSLSVSTDGE